MHRSRGGATRNETTWYSSATVITGRWMRGGWKVVRAEVGRAPGLADTNGEGLQRP